MEASGKRETITDLNWFMCVCVISCPYFEFCNYVYMRVKPPFLVRRMPLVEQTRLGCLEYKSKNKCFIGLNSSNHLLTYTVFNRNCFVNITVHANIRI